MRGFASWAAVAATVNVVSGHAVPLHSMRASELASKALHASHGLPSDATEPPVEEDFPFDWDLASSLAGLTGAPPTATAYELPTGLPSSFTKNYPNLGPWKDSSSSSEVQPTSTSASHISIVATSPTPKASYVLLNLNNAMVADYDTLGQARKRVTHQPQKHVRSLL